MTENNEKENDMHFVHFDKPLVIKKTICKKHGEHDVGLHLLKSDEFICMLCVRDLVGVMEVEYED